MTRGNEQQMTFDFGEKELDKVEAFHAEWDNARAKEKASRSRFAQHALDKDSVAAELRSVRDAIGRGEDVARFVRIVLQAANVPVTETEGAFAVHVNAETPRAFRQAIGRDESFTGRFDLPLFEGETYLGRTSPIVEGLAGWTLDQALDPVARDASPIASRCGVVATSLVSARTVLVIARFRYHLKISGTGSETVLCEEIIPLAATGTGDNLSWLDAEKGDQLLRARPEQNLVSTAIQQQVGLLAKSLPILQKSLEPVASQRAAAQLEAHERVREASKTKGRVSIEPVLPVDILGAYVLLPRLQ
jgi:hypothetical protein